MTGDYIEKIDTYDYYPFSLLNEICINNDIVGLEKALIDINNLNQETLMSYLFSISIKYDKIVLMKWLLNYFKSMNELRLKDVENVNNIKSYNVKEIVRSAFYDACVEGKLYIVKWLIRLEPYIYIDNYDGWLPQNFSYSCRNGHYKVVKWLLKNNSKKKLFNDSIESFKLACRNDHYKIVKLLLKEMPQIIKCDNYDNIFIKMCEKGLLRIAKLLLKNKPNLMISGLNHFIYHKHNWCSVVDKAFIDCFGTHYSYYRNDLHLDCKANVIKWLVSLNPYNYLIAICGNSIFEWKLVNDANVKNNTFEDLNTRIEDAPDICYICRSKIEKKICNIHDYCKDCVIYNYNVNLFNKKRFNKEINCLKCNKEFNKAYSNYCDYTCN